MAQLAEWLLPIPEVHDSNPLVSKNFIMNIFTVTWVPVTGVPVTGVRVHEHW